MDDKQFETLLTKARRPEPDAALYGNLMAQFENKFEGQLAPRSWRELLWPFGPIWQPAMSLVVAGFLGFAFAPQQQADDANQLASLDFDTLVLGESLDTEVSE